MDFFEKPDKCRQHITSGNEKYLERPACKARRYQNWKFPSTMATITKQHRLCMEKKVISDWSGGRKVQAQDSDRFQCLGKATLCFPDTTLRCTLRGDDHNGKCAS